MRGLLKAFGWSGLVTFAALTAAGMATLGYVHTTVSEIRNDLSVEVLREDSDIALAVQQMADLRQAVHAAGGGMSASQREVIDRRLRRAQNHLTSLSRDYELSQSEFIKETHGLAASRLSDLEDWLNELPRGAAFASPRAVDVEPFVESLGRTYAAMRDVYRRANASASARLEETAFRLEEFRGALILAFVFVGALLVTLFVVAFAYQRHQRQADEARGLLREAVNSSADGFAIFDADGRMVLCNARYAGFFPGMRSSIVPGRSFASILRESVTAGDLAIVEGNRENWLAERLRLFANPQEAPFESRLRDGRTLRVSERRLRDGSVVSVIADVTELRRGDAELRAIGEELRYNNMLLDAALSNMGQGLAMFDSQFRLVVCNRRYLEIFEFPEHLGKPGTTLETIVRECHGRSLSGEALDDTLEWRRDVARLRHEITDTEFLHDGRVIELHHRPMPGGGSLATYDDITERHRSQEALRHAKEEAEIANRTKSEFLANISHELRTPLNAVIGFSEVLESQMFGPLGDSRYKAYARDIQDSGRHLLSLINDILDLSKVESGRYVITDDRIDLADVSRACLRVVAERARTANITLKNEIPGDLPALRGDERAMKQILLNLLTNAVKFTPAAGEVCVAAVLQQNGGLTISVRDTGIGIASDDVEKALAPFGQVDSRLARKYEGTGLGLPLTKRLAELHGGWLSIDSKVGEGTRVTVGLPPERIEQPGCDNSPDSHNVFAFDLRAG